MVAVQPPQVSCNSFSLSSFTWITTLSPTPMIAAFCCSNVAPLLLAVDGFADEDELVKETELSEDDDMDEVEDEVEDEDGSPEVPGQNY